MSLEQQKQWRRGETQRGFDRLKKKFGSGERAERLTRTFQKLQVIRNYSVLFVLKGVCMNIAMRLSFPPPNCYVFNKNVCDHRHILPVLGQGEIVFKLSTIGRRRHFSYNNQLM